MTLLRPRTGVALSCILAAVPPGATTATAQTAVQAAEVPIHEVDLSDGTRRYTVTIGIAGRDVEAGLDTGSVGLRVLPGTADPATTKQTGPSQSYSYGAGTMLEGPVVRTTVSVGGLRGESRLQAVRAIGCIKLKPDCPVAGIDPAKYGIQGNGRPGEGFRAILGTGLATADLPNPLAEIGAHRWIIELPRPGEGLAGRLILNPSDEQIAGFSPLPLVDAHLRRSNDAVRACLAHDGGKPVCAPTLIDSGAPGIEIVNRRGDGGWTEGTPAKLVFGQSPEAAVAGVRFTVGRKTQASRFAAVEDSRVPGVRIRSGLLAYFAYDILYDADHGTMAVKARAPYPDGVTAIASSDGG